MSKPTLLFLEREPLQGLRPIGLAWRVAPEALRRKTNQVFDAYDCLWRLSDEEFFKRGQVGRAYEKGARASRRCAGEVYVVTQNGTLRSGN
jgi:hypothetical protein